jgi:4-hydroxybenzoate polyprenyltransferase
VSENPGERLKPLTAPSTLAQLPRRRSPLRATVAALRPRQWLKNLLLFAGILFAAELSDRTRWIEAIAAFVAYCAASSSAYLVNDVRDVEADRRHPAKRRRPIARGELRPRTAVVLAIALALVAFAIGAALGPWSLALLLAFVSLQAAYTLALKHVVLVDVGVIALLFVIRAAAGAVAVDVRISPWLLACTALLALFIALGKRRAELVVVGAEQTPGRAVLEGYSLSLVDQLLAAIAGATVVAYTTYTLSGGVVPRAMVVTVPFVVVGIIRYLQLLHRHALGEEPENVLLGDLPILLTVAGWAATCGVILVVS